MIIELDFGYALHWQIVTQFAKNQISVIMFGKFVNCNQYHLTCLECQRLILSALAGMWKLVGSLSR